MQNVAWRSFIGAVRANAAVVSPMSSGMLCLESAMVPMLRPNPQMFTRSFAATALPQIWPRHSQGCSGSTLPNRLQACGLAARRVHARCFSSASAPKPPSDGAVGGAAAAAAKLADEQRRRLAAARLQAHSQQGAASSSKNQMYYLVALIVGMVGLTYASVPLYRMFCQATGYGGTVKRKTVEDKIAESDTMDAETSAKVAQRTIKITFNSDVADGMPWKFTPSQKEVHVTPGQSVLAFYKAHNQSKNAITGVSTYNVTPMRAGPYFNKIQCFCFEEQRLRGGEQVDMPVFFYIDPEFALDPKMKNVDTLTLSYTFFKVEEEGKEEAPAPAA
mmetsp:Transcript_34260/g.65441  ORF Transcript_34260/g.65441 Transcript_34260/m.65441 type:complete len:332 (-) Transcript_34260:309-1304(-)